MTVANTIYIVDDDSSVRTSLARLLKLYGFVVESFADAETFLGIRAYKRPSCLILDVQMPGLSGLDLQVICEQNEIHIPIIFITGHGEVPMCAQAMKNGAVDFLPKPYKSEALLQAVNQALQNDRDQLQQERSFNKAQFRLHKLSDRERQVLQGVISGLLNKQIGYKLGIAEKTVKIHRANVMLKMNAASVPELVRMAESAGVDSLK